jgi:TrmH family RNA methyltransferase
VVEGPTLVGELLERGGAIESVFLERTAPAEIADRARAAGIAVFGLADGVVDRVAETASPQPVLAVVPFIDITLDRLDRNRLVVVLVDVRDPGNAGTILRTAEASGAGGVVFCEGSVDMYSPKTVRASAGSLFHIPVVAGCNPVEVLDAMATWGMRRLATVAQGGTTYTGVDLTGSVALVLGNEAHGLPGDISGHLDGRLTIPTDGRTESLNVAMAAAVLCFEAARQRDSGPSGRLSGPAREP